MNKLCTLVIMKTQNPFLAHYLSASRVNGAHSDEYLLLIHDETNGKNYNLKFPGSRRIREIKGDIHDLTNIAVRNQQWTGWPPNTDEENVSMGGLC